MFPSLDQDYTPSPSTISRSKLLADRVTESQSLWTAAVRSLHAYAADNDDLDVDRKYVEVAEQRHDTAISDLVAFLEEHGL